MWYCKLQREWRRKLAVREVERVHKAAEIRRREEQIQAEKDAIKLRETRAREAKLAAAKTARNKAVAERSKADEARAEAEVSVALPDAAYLAPRHQLSLHSESPSSDRDLASRYM